jgi:hypothetical protein
MVCGSTKMDSTGGSRVIILDVKSIEGPSHFYHFNNFLPILTLSDKFLEWDRDFDFSHFMFKVKRGTNFLYLFSTRFLACL